MKTIYCISGLGADERAFSRLQFDGYEVKHLPWLTPIAKETITAYATRMRQAITADNPILLGLSFGGMMCIEIAKQIPVEKVILVSSIQSSKQLPPWMRAAGFLKLNRIFPMKSYRITEPIQNRFIGISLREDIELVRSYRKNAPQQYLNWAINEVFRWNNDWQPSALFHVHGDADRIFPIRQVVPTHIIKGGGHFMIMNKAAEVNAALREILASN